MSSWNTSDHLLTSLGLARMVKENLPLHEQCVAVGPKLAAGCNRDKKKCSIRQKQTHTAGRLYGKVGRITHFVHILFLNTLVHMLFVPLDYVEKLKISLKSLPFICFPSFNVLLNSKLDIFKWTLPIFRVSMA